MHVTIEAETSLWTSIEIKDHNHDLIFAGCLEMSAGWWLLKRKHGGYYNERVASFAGHRDYVSVLGDALKRISKDTVK